MSSNANTTYVFNYSYLDQNGVQRSGTQSGHGYTLESAQSQADSQIRQNASAFKQYVSGNLDLTPTSAKANIGTKVYDTGKVVAPAVTTFKNPSEAKSYVQGGTVDYGSVADAQAAGHLAGYEGRTAYPPTHYEPTDVLGSNGTTAKIDYTLRAGESVADYTKRIEDAHAGIFVPTAQKYAAGTGLKVGSPIPAGNITPTPGLNLGSTLPTGGLDAASALVASGTAAVTETQKAADKLTKQLQDLLASSAGQSTALATEESKRGMESMLSQLADLNASIQTKTAEYQQLQTKNEGKPITMDSIIGNDRQILNAKAADIGLLTAQALGLQGKVTAAEDAAKRAVDVKFAPILESIKIKQAQLDLLKSTLDKENKAAADALDRAYQTQRDRLSIQMANEKDKNATILNLLQKYPDAGITMTDSIEDAQAKAVRSPSYRTEQNYSAAQLANETRLANTPTRSAADTQTQKEAADAPGALADLRQASGTDGYVSDESYAKIRQHWVAAGHTSASFDTRFSAWKSPNNT